MSAGCIGFLEIFPDCAALGDMCGGLDKAEVSSVVVNRAERTMEIEARFTRAPAPAELSGLEHELCEVFGLANVRIAADYPRQGAERWFSRAALMSGVSGVMPTVRPRLVTNTTPFTSRNCSSSTLFSSKPSAALWAAERNSAAEYRPKPRAMFSARTVRPFSILE